MSSLTTGTGTPLEPGGLRECVEERSSGQKADGGRKIDGCQEGNKGDKEMKGLSDDLALEPLYDHCNADRLKNRRSSHLSLLCFILRPLLGSSMQNWYQQSHRQYLFISLFDNQLTCHGSVLGRHIPILSTFLPEEDLFLIQGPLGKSDAAPSTGAESRLRLPIDSSCTANVYQTATVVDGRLTQRPRVLPSHGRSHWFKSSIAQTSPCALP